MNQEQEKIVLFPKWKEVLERESLAALKNKQYELALGKLEELIKHRIDHQEIMVGKVICLMELGRQEEAADFSLELIDKKDAGYYHYVHIYLTILFQQHQYKELLERVDLEMESNLIPSELKEQFLQLYAISKNMHADFKTELLRKYSKTLKESIYNEDHRKQFAIIEQMRFNDLETNDEIRMLLMKEFVHPVVKTAIFRWLVETEYKEPVTIIKFGQTLELTPKLAMDINNNPFLRTIELKVLEIEQENPVLYDTIVKILKRFIYVTYPLNLQAYKLNHFLSALLLVARHSYNSVEEKSDIQAVNTYIEEINMSQMLYLSIIDE